MGDRAELLTRLAAAVADQSEGESLTARLCEAARRLLGADGASITLDAASPNRVTLCATNGTAARLESIQDVVGQGPSMEAFDTGRPVVVDFGAPASNWSVYAESATRQTDAVFVVALPMRAGSAVLGVLTLHRASGGSLTEEIGEAAFIADALAAAILDDPSGLSDLGDSGSWSNRAEIHQATGMVVAQLAIAVPDALAIMRAHAFALDRTLADVAHSVVTRDLVFSRDAR
jgi:transcriptional regulator with GAF, ATPase, and Fis domain